MAHEYQLHREQTVPVPLADVFEFFADPRNLGRITPAWLSFRMLNEGEVVMHEGLKIDYRIRPLGFPQRWTSIISTWDPPHRFVDEQVRGPYRRWLHLHEFRAVEGGTVISDQVSYELPLGLLGRLAHAAFVRRQLTTIFDYRTRAVLRLLVD
ncbi:MAG: SRPBCC family protein [Gemmatimonadota bacterium]|nr:SRPBCC family protein [Gemmatimonadota bacterium]